MSIRQTFPVERSHHCELYIETDGNSWRVYLTWSI
jgi:hypothetical protein